MDTRNKILDGAGARRVADAGATVVSGYFDPLVSTHARRLAELKRDGVKMLVVITNSPDAILPARARAELVASLACVDYVTEAAADLTPHIQLEREDEARREALIEHVHTRQRAAG